MDIEELRRKAMASMPHKKKKQQQHQASSDPQPGKSPASNLFDTNVVQTPVISCAPSPASVSGSHKERDALLSSLQDLHQSARSSSAEERDDNLVIRFSDGESDSDAEENHLKMNERHGDMSFRGFMVGSSANHSPAASSQMVTSASQHTPGMLNQMAMMKKQLAAMRTSMSSAIQVRGAASGASADGSIWKSSSKQKIVIGQKNSIGQKRGVKPGASVTKPSGSNLDNLRKQITTKGGTDLEKLRKQITNKGIVDLENLRKQIATKENELKVQRHMKLGKGQGMVSAPNGKVHPPGIGESTSGIPSIQMCISSASLNLVGTSDKEMEEENEKVLHVTVQELPDLKVIKSSLQQQRRNTLNTDTNYNFAKDASIDNNPVTNLHIAGYKRPHAEDNPVERKCQKAADVIDGNKVATIQSNSDSVQKNCTTPSKRVMPENFHHANINCFPEREGIKKRKTDGPSLESRSDIHLANHQSSTHYTPDHQRHSSVEGFPNKEGEKVQLEIKKTKGQFMRESAQTADIENSSQKMNSGLEQSIVNCWTNAKEEKDGSSVRPFIKEGCSYLTYGRQHVEPARGNKSISDTFGDITQGEQKTGGSVFFTSRELVHWQGSRDSQSNTRLIGIRIQDDLLQSGNTSAQYLIKEEEAVDKELEEARQHRSRCEMEEKIAWKAYRNAQIAVQAINERCMNLHEKRRMLSAQIQAVALRTYSSLGSPERAVGRKEEFHEPQSCSGHKNLSNAVEVTPFLQDHLEASEQPAYKLNEYSSIVDNAINPSLQPLIGNNWSSSNYGIQSVKQNSSGRLTVANVIGNAANGLCMDNKKVDMGKIYDSVDSGVAANRNQDIDSCEPELLIDTSGQKNEMEEKHPVSRELTFEMSEAFQSHQSQISENMELCKISEYGLIREKNLKDSVIDTKVENGENCELKPKSSITPVALSDEKPPAVEKSGGPNFEQVTTEHICLPQKRKRSNQIPVSECSADDLAKISNTSVSKLNLGMDLFSLKEKTKEEGTASPGAETSAESLHAQNYDQECNIQLPVCFAGKIEEFAHACSLSQEVPEETVKTTALGHLTGDDVHENSTGTCHSENSHASAIENGKANNKSFTANFSSSICKKVNFEESNEEKCHSGSGIDEGCAIEKETMAAWKNPLQELATSGNSGGSVAFDVAYMENQDSSMQHIGSAYSGQKTLEENFAKRRKYCEEASNQLLESNLLMSSELKVVFSYAKAIFANNNAIIGGCCGKMTQVILQDIPEYFPRFLLYESPLDMFKSYSVYSNLIAADGTPDKSITCSHVINPFWPLCKFEHRGKCNNEECPWQHARDYNLNPPQFAEHLKYCNTEMDSSARNCVSRGNQDSDVCFEIQTKEAITRGFKFHFALTAGNSVLQQGFSCRIISNYGLTVPVYRIGSHLIKADVPMVGALIAQSTWRFWKLGFCQSFAIPFANQRLLLPDMACLHSVAVREWMLGNNSRLPTCLYSSSVNPDDTKAWKHLFRGLENVECWLELAIDSMNFDSNIDKLDGRKKALCVLSRAIEANPNSVALWVVYLHIFYRKEKVIGKDDMFYHAVQHNEGSYELWLLFINSRLQMDQRLEAYQNAISALCLKACASEMQDKSSSSYVLDLVLQMLNFLSLSGYKEKAMTWIDELSCSTEGFNKNEQSDFSSVFTVLSCLTKKDACVLWVSCTYYRVYGELPKAILGRLEFEQNLPFDVEWQSRKISETVIACILKMMDNAVSNLNGCHDHSSQSWKNDGNSLLPAHALVINHVKCVLAIEGLGSARKLCLQYRELYPFCIELLLISSSIESHSGNDRAGIAFFDESLSNWPESKPGIQRFWNQYVGYVLESKGADSAKNIIDKWYFYMDQHKMLDRIISLRDIDYLTCSPLGHAVGKQEVEEYKDRKKKDHDFFSETEVDRRSWCQDVMFALLNLAIYRFLNNDPQKAQSAVDQALKVALDDGDVKQCIKECAALALFGVPDESEPMKNGFDTRMLQLFDKCFLRYQLFPLPKPLSRAFTESIKKPKIRIFIENLLGPIPVDCSLLNSILEIWHGPSLLPEHFGAFKDLVDFIEALLELAPANFKLVLSICRMVVQRCNSQSISSVAALFWASSLLINSIFQSFPIAPENAWLEVVNFLELLDVDVILEEFYQQALSVHPFSVALWHSFLNFRRGSENLAGVVETAKERGINID
ncbi:uncharacterized protein LOC131036087 isoform X2 [Cryptomeria japonica]|uniref:uncharacterized protein LOC131036087 isoform X2 n=1 Tax=Cryptomeria japonica TaxID=3369 RepID=UPI0027D9E279|nr:uncharacterized protein LOC131036087 isoform X2 [Cryptomeria japonica]